MLRETVVRGGILFQSCIIATSLNLDPMMSGNYRYAVYMIYRLDKDGEKLCEQVGDVKTICKVLALSHAPPKSEQTLI